MISSFSSEVPRLLVTGTSGQVGGEIAALAGHRGFQLLPAPRSCLDFSRPETLFAVLDEMKPDIVINPAAYTAVDKAESEPDLAFRINAEAPEAVARWCAARGVPLIHFSTDYVFDGCGTRPYPETAPVAPVGVYGASKAAGEQAVRDSGAACLILRTAWVYGAQGKNFLKTMLRLGAERNAVSVVNDQKGTPTSARSIARGVFAALPRFVADPEGCGGIYHYTDQGETTWWGFARRIFELAEPYRGQSPEVLPISTSQYPTPARRPAYSVLCTHSFTSRFGFSPPFWEESLQEEINRLFQNDGRAGCNASPL